MAKPIDPRTEIGHVHLKVSDLDRALAFYSGVLGFEVTQRMGPSAAFLSAGGYHHHIGLNTWESQGGRPPAAARPVLSLRDPLPGSGRARRRAAPAARRAVPLDGASDHGVSEALYLRDPDGNGIELYWDRPRAEWPREADGTLQMVTERLDLDALLAAATVAAPTLPAPQSPYALMTEQNRARLRELRGEAAAAAQGAARRRARRVRDGSRARRRRTRRCCSS